jgi:2-succinyl-6-hydroxy-2,4-cyclohexadiene-1-carboxylate synthase
MTFVHGYTQTSRSWDLIIDELSSTFLCNSLDAPGHGESLNGQRTLPECGEDIAESMTTGILVGYSMGARMALHTALQHPEKVTQLVLVSGTAGLEDSTDRAQRCENDNQLADRLISIGVQKFLTEWLALPMFAGLTPNTAQMNDRLRNSSEGLADSLRFAGTGTQEPLWHRLGELSMPVLLIAGKNDEKFVQLAQRMHTLIPTSRLEIVPNSGHTVHLEQPSQFIRLVTAFAS